MKYPRALLIVALAAVSSGCGPDDEPAYCRVEMPSTAAPTLTVLVGVRTADGFVAWNDTDVIAWVRGGQGAVMITPSIRVEGAPVGVEPLCARIRFDNRFATSMGGDMEGITRDEPLSPRNGGFEGGPFENPLQFEDVGGRTLTLDTTVQTESLAGEAAVTVDLAP